LQRFWQTALAGASSARVFVQYEAIDVGFLQQASKTVCEKQLLLRRRWFWPEVSFADDADGCGSRSEFHCYTACTS